MKLKTRYELGESFGYPTKKGSNVSNIVNIMTSTFINEKGEIQTNEIYTLADGYIFGVPNTVNQ